MGAHPREILWGLPPEGARQTRPSARLAGNFLLPRAFGRRLAHVSSPLQTLPKFPLVVPGSFGLPSEETVGQTAPRSPNSPGPSTWEVGVEVDIFWKQGLK